MMKFIREYGLAAVVFAQAAALICLSGCADPENVEPDDNRRRTDLTLIVIDDINDRPQDSLLNNRTVWKSLEDKGHKLKSLDRTNPAATPFLERLKDSKVELPALFVQKQATGDTSKPIALPATPEELRKIVNRYGGKSIRGPPVYTDADGNERKLAVRRPAAADLKRFAKFQSYGEMLKSKGQSLIPRDKWKEIEHPEFKRPEFTLNQFNTSGCVGYSSAAAEGKSRWLRGHKFEILSGAFSYSGINRGRDDGALILDSMVHGKTKGFCLKTEFDLPNKFDHQVPQEARDSAMTRQMTLGWPVNTIDELATAIQNNLIVQCGVCVDGNFERFDADGVSSARGRYANHSVHIDGMRKIKGRWVFRMPNTWGHSWGPFKDGSCYLTEQGVILDADAYVHGDSEWRPDELPTPKKGSKDHANDPNFTLAF